MAGRGRLRAAVGGCVAPGRMLGPLAAL